MWCDWRRFQKRNKHSVKKSNSRILMLQMFLPKAVQKHRAVCDAVVGTHIMVLVDMISIFLESENWSSAGICSTSVKPLISITPSTRVLHLKPKGPATIVSLSTFATVPRRHTWKLTCRAPSSWPALSDGGRAARDGHPHTPSRLGHEKAVSIYQTPPQTIIAPCFKQTSAPPQLHHLSVRDPSITGEKNVFSLRGLHHYFGAVPLIVPETSGLFCHVDHQHLSQRSFCPDGESPNLK